MVFVIFDVYGIKIIRVNPCNPCSFLLSKRGPVPAFPIIYTQYSGVWRNSVQEFGAIPFGVPAFHEIIPS